MRSKSAQTPSDCQEIEIQGQMAQPRIREEIASDLGIESDATEDFLDVILGCKFHRHFWSHQGGFTVFSFPGYPGCSPLPDVRFSHFGRLGVSRRYPDVVFRLRIFHPHEMAEVAKKVTNPQAWQITYHKKHHPSGDVGDFKRHCLRFMIYGCSYFDDIEVH